MTDLNHHHRDMENKAGIKDAKDTENTEDAENKENTKNRENIEKSALPLKGEKSYWNNYTIIALVILLFSVFLQGLFFHHKDKSKESPKTADESYTTLSPMTKESLGKSSLSNTLDKERELKQKIAEAKAKDFMDRLQVSQSVASDGVSAPVQASNSATASNTQNAAANMADTTSSDPNTAFLVSASNSKAERSLATRFGPTPYVVGQGKFIFGTLSVAINSDLPGQIEAVVNQDVYGESGRRILIPRGSHLIGEYRSGLSNHQSRLFTVWTRVKEPNGIDISLGSPGTDSLGEGGQSGQVDYHFVDRFGGAFLISMISAGASTVGVSTSDQYNSIASYRQSVSQALAEQAKNTLSDNISIPPTIRIPQGERIVVFVNRDLDFSRVYR